MQAWIVVGPVALERLLGARRVAFALRDGVEVFDGTELYSYPAGSAQVPADEVARLMDGAAYVDESERASIRRDLGDAIVAALAVGYSAPDAGIETNLTTEQLGKLFGDVKSPPVRADKTP